MVVENKPRLLILLDRLVVGGQAVDILPLAFYFKDTFQVRLLYGAKKLDDTEATYLLSLYPNVDIVKIPALKKTWNIIENCKAYIQINNEIKKFKPHIVHTNAAKCGIIGRIAARQNHIPIILHTFHGHFFHSYFNKLLTSFLIALEKRLANITNIIVATSNSQLHDLVYQYKIAPLEKVKVVPLGIDEAFLFSDKSTTPLLPQIINDTNIIKIGIIARIVHIKNFQLFVDVVEQTLKQTNKKIIFFIVGDGYLKHAVEQQLSDKSITWSSSENPSPNSSVIFTSWVSNIGEILNKLDIVVLTSNNEGTGLSLAESQYCGKPVVATNVGGVPDTIIDGQTGFLAKPNDTNDFTEKLLKLIEDDELRNQMGKAAYQFARKKFSKKSEINNLTKLYLQLLKESNLRK